MSPVQWSIAADGISTTDNPICDPSCDLAASSAPRVTTASGLQYVDLIEGDGPTPEPGMQVVVDYVAANEDGLIFSNTVEAGKPVDIRVTGIPDALSVIAGLDEGALYDFTGI